MIVTFEDRASHHIGIKLLAISLAEHNSQTDFTATVTEHDKALEEWFAAAGLRLTLRERTEGIGWNMKPILLREALESGAAEAIWLDSDIIVTRNPDVLWRDCSPGTLVVSEEYLSASSQGGTTRTLAWGLPVGRSMPSTTNTCVVRVTSEHLELLKAWEELLNASEYRRAQARPWNERPRHLAGDQDVLCALLGSERFADIRKES